MILVHDVRESTDTYMIYDQIFTVHTTHTHTHTSVTIIIYIYDNKFNCDTLIGSNHCTLHFDQINCYDKLVYYTRYNKLLIDQLGISSM